MDVLIIIVLIIAAVILFLVELFVIPGISFAGIAALGCIIFANYYAFSKQLILCLTGISESPSIRSSTMG